MQNLHQSKYVVHNKLSNIDYSKMAQNLKKARIINGLAQKDIAQALGTTTTYISNIENGKTKLNLQVIIAYSQICCFSIDHLIDSVCIPSKEDTLDVLDYKIYMKVKKLSKEDKIKLIKIINIL